MFEKILTLDLEIPGITETSDSNLGITNASLARSYAPPAYVTAALAFVLISDDSHREAAVATIHDIPTV